MKYVIHCDETTNLDIFMDADRKPTKFEQHKALEWYQKQPHHSKGYPERNRVVTLVAVGVGGILRATGHSCKRTNNHDA